MEHFFHLQPKVAAVRRQVRHGRATWDSMASQVWTRRLGHSSGAPGESRLPAGIPQLPACQQAGKKLQTRPTAYTTPASGDHGAFAFESLLQAASKGSNPACTTAPLLQDITTINKTCGNKSHDSQRFVSIFYGENAFSISL